MVPTFKKLLEKLCCNHDWQEIKEIKLYSDLYSSKMPYCRKFIFVCKKCGKFKKITV